MKKRRYLLISAIPLTLVLSLLFLSGDSRAPQVAAADDETIPGRYIVVLKDTLDASSVAFNLERRTDIQPNVVYDSALNGFAAEMTDAEAQSLSGNPNVLAVEPDRMVSIDLHNNNFQTLTEGPNRIDLEENTTANVTGQPSGTQLDIDVAVLDTGTITSHPDLNVAGGKGFTGSGCSDAGFEDDHGHGGHVSGSVAARDNDRGLVGTAPGARVWGVKVLNSGGSGANSCVIAGIDWVTNRRLEFNDGAGDGDPGVNIAVANMSLGGETNVSPLNDPMCLAINNSTAAGVIYAVAAGNDAQDVQIGTPGSPTYIGSSPAHCLNAITVSAFGDFDGLSGGLSPATASFSSCQPPTVLTHDDEFACFSNFGAAVDIAAPGVNILSTYMFGGCGPAVPCYASMSGTSMATPHVAGALALFKIASGYSGAANGPAVMIAFTAGGYTRTQASACGFTGDPDIFPEPMLYVGTSCTGVPQTTPSPSPTPSPTLSPSPTPIPTPSPTPSPTKTPSPTPSPTPIPTPTPTPTPTPSPTPTPTPTPSASTSASVSPTLSENPSETPTPSPTATATVTPVPTLSASPAPDRLQGDANCDDAVTGVDSLQILLAIGNLPSSSCSGAPDTNCNGHIDLLDALLILRYLAGHPSDIADCTDVGDNV